MPDLNYGPLKATDVPDLAVLHRNAFPEFFLSSLGDRFLREFYTSFLSDQTTVTVIARRGGVPVGSVVGTTQPDSFFKRLLLRRLPGFAMASAAASLRDPRKIPRLARAVRYRGGAGPTGTSGALLSSICVDPREQGTGVGAELVRRWMGEARSQGAVKAYLTTDRDDNDAVNAFYTRLGWTLSDTYTTQEGRQMNVYAVDLPLSPSE